MAVRAGGTFQRRHARDAATRQGAEGVALLIPCAIVVCHRRRVARGRLVDKAGCLTAIAAPSEEETCTDEEGEEH